MIPFIIWAATRTSSTNLCRALGAENEPFQAGPPESRLAWSYRRWREDRSTRAIELLCENKISIKHIAEAFDDEFNIALARTALHHGYRHIHLVRLNEVARLISLDVAGQLDAWWPHDAKDRFEELKESGHRLNPLDVPRLLENSRQVMRSWHAVAPYIHPKIRVTYEDLITKDSHRRESVLRWIVNYLEFPISKISELDEAMRTGGQNSAQVRDLIPNIFELRMRMTSEGLR